MPVFSILDTKPSHILDFPLTVQQQIWFLFFLPTLWLTIIYMVDIATDIAVGIELINEGHFLPGGLTVLIIFLPPLLIYFRRLYKPPDTKEVKVVFTWFFIETAALIFFPIRPLQCFAERLLWSVEAIRLDDPKREECLIEFEQTRVYVIENYMFLQALIQAGPQALLQMLLLTHGTSNYLTTEIVQGICLLTSLASLALVTSSYQRYETEVRGGRHQVWSSRDRSLTNLLNTTEFTIHSNQQGQKWIKVIEEDNPLGSILSFSFWFFFIFGRILCLVVAYTFFPWIVFGVCVAHYIFSLAYILTISERRTSIANKLILAFIYIFCLIEVGIQFRKSRILFSLFFFFTIMENISLTLLWVLWAKWHGNWYYYCLLLMTILHGSATCLILIYLQFFKPQIKIIEAN